MIRQIVMLTAGLLLVTSAAIAAPYVSGNVGVVSVLDSDLSVAGTGVGEVTFDLGFGIMGAAGTQFMPGVRGEVEIAYRTADVDSVFIPGFGTFTGGDASSLSVMANVFKDFGVGGSVAPFIGAGLGLANVELDDGATTEDDTVFAYQLALGAGYALSNSLTLEAQYRFFGTTDPDFSGVEAEYMTHNFLFGARVNF